MVWFLVDDNLALHQKVIRAGNPAMGLWVRAGSWSAANLTDGYVPSNVARDIGNQYQIRKLVDTGLWSSVPGGYQFHDWADRQPTADQVRQRRDSARQRKAKQRGKPDVTPPVTRDSHARARPSPLQDLGSLPHQGAVPAPPPHPAAPAKRKPECPFRCDENDGYKPNGLVCDHVDRTESHAVGMAATIEAINEAKARKANQ